MTGRKQLVEENSEDIVNNSEDSVINDYSSQNHDSHMSAGNINRPISFESEENDCSDNEETESIIEHRKKGWKKAQSGLVLPLFGSQAYRLNFRKFTGMFWAIYYPGNNWAYKQKNLLIRSTVPKTESLSKIKKFLFGMTWKKDEIMIHLVFFLR